MMNQPLLQIKRQPVVTFAKQSSQQQQQQLPVTKLKNVEQRQASSQLQQSQQQKQIAPQQKQVIVTPPKQQQNLTVAQQHLTEVKGIFNRVDDVLKQRSDTCARLAWEISDLRIQLEYVAKTTKEQAETSAAQQSMLEWSKARLAELQVDHERVKRDYVDPLDHLTKELKDITLEGQETGVTMNNEIIVEIEKLKQLKEELINIEQTFERVKTKHSRLTTAIQSSKNKLGDINSNNETKAKSLEELRNNLCSKQEYLLIMRESDEMALNDLISELERKEILMKQIEYIKISLDSARASIRAIAEKKEQMLSSHEKVKTQLTEQIQQIESNMKLKDAELNGLMSELDTAKAKEEGLLKQISQDREELKRLKIEHEDNHIKIEATKQELGNVLEKQNTLSSEIASLKSQIESIIAENEKDYESTCQALKELHELHATNAQLHCRLEALKEEYDCKLKQETTRLENINIENQQLESQLEDASRQKREVELRVKILMEKVMFAEEDLLSTQFENALTLLHNERVKQMNEAHQEEMNRQAMEREEMIQLEYLYDLKSQELKHMEQRSHELHEEEIRLEQEFEIMTKSSGEDVELTEEDMHKLEEEVQQEMEQIYAELDADFAKQQSQLQQSLDEIAKRSTDEVHADLINEIANLESQLELEKKLLQELQEEHPQEPSQSTQRVLSQVSPQRFSPDKLPSPPSYQEEGKDEEESQFSFMQDTFPLEEIPKPPKRHLQSQQLSRLAPKQKAQKIQPAPAAQSKSINRTTTTVSTPTASRMRASSAKPTTPAATVTVSASKIANTVPFVTPPPSSTKTQAAPRTEDMDSMDSGTISKVKSSRRLIVGQPTEAPFVSATATASKVPQKKTKFEAVTVPKSSLDDWFNDNGDL